MRHSYYRHRSALRTSNNKNSFEKHGFGSTNHKKSFEKRFQNSKKCVQDFRMESTINSSRSVNITFITSGAADSMYFDIIAIRFRSFNFSTPCLKSREKFSAKHCSSSGGGFVIINLWISSFPNASRSLFDKKFALMAFTKQKSKQNNNQTLS